MTDTTPNVEDPVVIAVVTTSFEAHAIATWFRERGIPADARGPDSAPAVPWSRKPEHVAIVVSAAHAEEARALREAEFDADDAIEWEAVDVGEREDDLPLTPARHIPGPAKFTAWVGIAVLIISAVALVLVVLL